MTAQVEASCGRRSRTLARLSGEAESIRKMNLLTDKVASTLQHSDLQRHRAPRVGQAVTHANVRILNGGVCPVQRFDSADARSRMEEFRVSSADVIENTDQSIKRLNALTMKGLASNLAASGLQANNMAQAIRCGAVGYDARTNRQLVASLRFRKFGRFPSIQDAAEESGFWPNLSTWSRSSTSLNKWRASASVTEMHSIFGGCRASRLISTIQVRSRVQAQRRKRRT